MSDQWERGFVIEQKLRDIYYDPSIGLQTAERLYQKSEGRWA